MLLIYEGFYALKKALYVLIEQSVTSCVFIEFEANVFQQHLNIVILFYLYVLQRFAKPRCNPESHSQQLIPCKVSNIRRKFGKKASFVCVFQLLDINVSPYFPDVLGCIKHFFDLCIHFRF